MALTETNRSHSFLILLLAVAVGIGLLVGGIRPALRASKAASSEREKVRAQAQALTERLARAQEGAASLRSLDPALVGRVSSLIASGAEEELFVFTLDSLALTNNFVLTSLEVAPAKGEASRGALQDIQLTAQLKGGGYRDLKGFLANLTTTLPILDITALTYNPESATLTLNLTAYGVAKGFTEGSAPDPALLNDPRLEILRPVGAAGSLPSTRRENPFSPLSPP